MWRWLSVLPLALAMGPAAAAELRFLALGDSYTIGEDVAEEGRWPVQLAALLRAEGLAVDPPVLIARTGWTTDELSAAMDEAGLAPGYDLVSLLIGVNNQYRGRGLDEYGVQFSALLERAIGFAGGRAGRVLVLSIPDWGTTPFGLASGRDTAAIASALDGYNAAARAACDARGVAFVDITPASRAPGADVADDGLHPGAGQYAAWTALALPVAAGLLKD